MVGKKRINDVGCIFKSRARESYCGKDAASLSSGPTENCEGQGNCAN